jgi:hypothetical protein
MSELRNDESQEPEPAKLTTASDYESGPATHEIVDGDLREIDLREIRRVELEVRETYVLARCFTGWGKHVLTCAYPTSGRVDLDEADFEGETLREIYTAKALADLAAFSLSPRR